MMSNYDSHFIHIFFLFVVILVVGLIWKCLIRPFMERLNPIMDVPLARGSHWFGGHAYLFRKNNKSRNKGKAVVCSDVDFRDIQRILAIDSASQNGHTSFWIYQQPHIALYHWQDVDAVQRLSSGRFNCIHNTSRFDSVAYESSLSFILNLFPPAIYRRLNTTEKRNNEINFYRSVLARFCQDGAAASLMESIIEKIMSPKLNMIESKMRTEQSNGRKLANYSPSIFLVKEATRFTFQVDCVVLIRRILLELWGQFFFSRPLDDDAISSCSHHDDGIVEGFKKLVFPTNNSCKIANQVCQTEVVARSIHRFVQRQILERSYKKDLLNSNIASSRNETTSRHPDALETLLTYSNMLRRKQDRKGQQRCYSTSHLPDFITSFLIEAIWSIHRLKCNFPRPEEFRPDRWVYQENQPDCRSSNGRNLGCARWTERPLSDASSDIPAANRKAFISSFSSLSGCYSSCGNTPIDHLLLANSTLIFAVLLKALKFEMTREYVLIPDLVSDVQFPKGGMPLQITLRREVSGKNL